MAQGTRASAAALSEFLQHYRRISVGDACRYRIDHSDADLSIWVNQRGTWRQLRPAERKLKWDQYKAGRSVCQSIVRGLFGLTEAQYRTVQESFDDPAWKTWAGIYQLDDDSLEGPKFAIVVELPDDSSDVAGGVGAAAGLTLGAVGALAVKHLYERSKSGSIPSTVNQPKPTGQQDGTTPQSQALLAAKSNSQSSALATENPEIQSLIKTVGELNTKLESTERTLKMREGRNLNLQDALRQKNEE
jgi:hypothetical protein